MVVELGGTAGAEELFIGAILIVALSCELVIYEVYWLDATLIVLLLGELLLLALLLFRLKRLSWSK